MASTSAVTIRPAVPADLPALTAIYNHYVRQTPTTFDIEPFSIDERAVWFSHYAAEGPHRLFVAESAGEVLGYACSSTFRLKPAYVTSVETSIYCHPARTGAGIGRRLYEALFAALDGQDVHRAYAGITLPNDTSVALHRRFGFTEVGVENEVGRKFGQYWDVLLMEKPLP